MTKLELCLETDLLVPNSYWELKNNVNGYKNPQSQTLSTQAKSGRVFQFIDIYSSQNFKETLKRVKVRLVEDGYDCWFNSSDIDKNAYQIDEWKPVSLSRDQIKQKLPKILDWLEIVSKTKNRYLWGGTIGPNFDCSGLTQTAFAYQNIWLPRDAYQQEKFCKRIDFDKNSFTNLFPGDLIFFGSEKKCSHVGIYKGNGLYWHSSGVSNGRDGIGIDQLQENAKDKISSYYRSILRGAGRIESCHDGSTII